MLKNDNKVKISNRIVNIKVIIKEFKIKKFLKKLYYKIS